MSGIKAPVGAGRSELETSNPLARTQFAVQSNCLLSTRALKSATDMPIADFSASLARALMPFVSGGFGEAEQAARTSRATPADHRTLRLALNADINALRSELALSISPDAGRCHDALAALVALDVPTGLAWRLKPARSESPVNGSALHTHILDGVVWQANAGPNYVTKSHTFNDHQGNWSTNLSGSATCA